MRNSLFSRVTVIPFLLFLLLATTLSAQVMIPVFRENFESGFGNWSATGLWHLQANSTCLSPPYASPVHAAIYNQEATCTYNTGGTNWGTLDCLVTIDLSAASAAELSFKSYEQTETGGSSSPYDLRSVYISTDGGTSWESIPVWSSSSGSTEGNWYRRNIDLSTYVGGTINIRFDFNTGDSIGNNYLGWYIDDIEVQAEFPNGGYDLGVSARQTTDGGYIFSGFTNSFIHGSFDYLIYKLDSSGNKQWRKNYGGSSVEFSYFVQQTADGGYIVAGFGVSFTYGGADFLVYKLDASGNKVWRKNYGGVASDLGVCIRQTTDGGYILLGTGNSFTYGSADFLVYKLDANGNKVWRKNYGGVGWDAGISVVQTTDGGYAVFGESDSFSYGYRDFILFKLDSNGNKQWRKNYGGPGDEWGWLDIGFTYLVGGDSLDQTSDGGYVFCGGTDSFSYGGFDFLVYKVNASGVKQWRKNYGGIFDDAAFSIQQTSDSGYIVAGFSESFTHGAYDFLVYKLDSSGNKQWRKNYGGMNEDVCLSVQQTSDGGYIVSGGGNSFTHTPGAPDFLIYKLDANGNKVWRKNFGG